MGMDGWHWMDSDDVYSNYLILDILSYLAILSVKCRIYVISQGGTSPP